MYEGKAQSSGGRGDMRASSGETLMQVVAKAEQPAM